MNDFKIDVPLSEILGNLNNEPIEVSLNTNELNEILKKIYSSNVTGKYDYLEKRLKNFSKKPNFLDFSFVLM